MMPALLAGALLGLPLASAGLLLGRMLPGARTRHAFQQWLFLGLAVLPLLAPALPSLLPLQDAPVFAAPLAHWTPVRLELDAAAGGAAPADWGFWLLLAWAAGAGICLCRPVRQWRHYARLAAAAEPVDTASLGIAMSDFALRATAAPVTPYLLAWRRPTVVIPLDLLAPARRVELRAVLQHEAAHLARGDARLGLLNRLILAAYWFNPGLWWLSARLQSSAELAADEHCLAAADAGQRKAYARALLASARARAATLPAGIPGFHSPARRLAMRIHSILNARRQRHGRRQRWGAFLLSLALLLPASWLHTALADAPALQFAAPLATGHLTAGFGERINPFTHQPYQHQGVDIGAAPGTPVLAPAAGDVSFAGNRGDTKGNVVELNHANGYRSLFAHLQRIDVAPGSHVQAGDRLGTVGSSGKVTGPHLHLEVFHHGKPVNPASVMPLVADADTPPGIWIQMRVYSGNRLVSSPLLGSHFGQAAVVKLKHHAGRKPFTIELTPLQAEAGKIHLQVRAGNAPGKPVDVRMHQTARIVPAAGKSERIEYTLLPHKPAKT